MVSTKVTTTRKGNTVTFAGGGEFSTAELEQIGKKITPDMRKQLNLLNREYLELDVARAALQRDVKRALRDNQETAEYKRHKNLKADLKLLDARVSELRIKGLGIMEMLVNSVRRGTAMYQKILMLMVARSNGKVDA